MIAIVGFALAFPSTVDLADSTFVPLDNLSRAIDCSRFACSNQWKGRGRVITSTPASAATSAATSAAAPAAARFGNTAFKIGRTWALIDQCVTSALRCPTAAATTSTSGLGAALDIVRGIGTGIADEFSSCRGAFGGRNAHTGSVITARTRTVQNGSLSKISGIDNADAKIGCSEGDGEKMHYVTNESGACEDCVKSLEMMNVAGFVFDLYVERPWTVRTVA